MLDCHDRFRLRRLLASKRQRIQGRLDAIHNALARS
jgi:hypothetical protein